MTAIIAERPNKPLLVIPAEANNVRLYLLLKCDNRVDALLAIGTPVNVVAKEHDGVAVANRAPHLAE
jgi:hypothetical protein